MDCEYGFDCVCIIVFKIISDCNLIVSLIDSGQAAK